MKTADATVEDYVARVDKALRDLPKPRRIGDPADIAAEARERFGIADGPAATWRESTAVVLLLAGWLAPFLGTIVALILLWISRVWSWRQKVAATFLMPGTLLLPAAFLVTLSSEGSVSGCPVQVGGGGPVPCDTGGGGGGVGPIEILALLVLFALIGATTASLIRSIRRSRQTA
jgi:hypothetical protein